MEWTPRPLVEHLREQERHNMTVITVGSKYEVYVRSPASSHMQTLKQPFQTLQIKWEVNIFLKKSSCVFFPASFICASVVYHASVIIASVCIQYIYVCNRGIKSHFSSLWYDSTWDWTQVFWAIGEHSNRYDNNNNNNNKKNKKKVSQR